MTSHILNALLTSFTLATGLSLQAQLFYDKTFHTGTAAIKARHYSGTGGKGYWSLLKLDSLGRPAEQQQFKKKQLMAITTYQYNAQNDRVAETVTNDINNPGEIRTTHHLYTYDSNIITSQKSIYPGGDSTVYRLARREGDSILTYENIFYHPANRENPQSKTTYILTFRNQLLVRKEQVSSDSTKDITVIEHYPNGKISHRTIERIPKPKFEAIYTGGPGSDDQYYSYDYDRKGRIKTYYTTVSGKRNKLSTYSYTER